MVQQISFGHKIQKWRETQYYFYNLITFYKIINTTGFYVILTVTYLWPSESRAHFLSQYQCFAFCLRDPFHPLYYNMLDSRSYHWYIEETSSMICHTSIYNYMITWILPMCSEYITLNCKHPGYFMWNVQ